MKTTKEAERQCPKCASEENQVNFGHNRSGTQRCKCQKCGATYTLQPKTRSHSEETQQQAMKIYYAGVSGRGVGKVMGLGKNTVLNWIKKKRRINC